MNDLINDLPKEKVEKIKKSEEENQAKEKEETKMAVRNVNVDALARIVTNIEQENNEIKSGNVKLRAMITKAMRDIEPLRAELIKLKAMGARGNLGGTGSTVHKKDE